MAASTTQFHSDPKFDDFPPDSTLTNEDLHPTISAQRTFSALDFASLWVGLVVGVPTYYLSGSLVDLGMTWWQGTATVAAANTILLFPLILTAHAGTRYGIPFPVLARSSFGIRGAHIPTLLRALVSCGWYGIESWIGGQAIFLLLPHSVKESASAKPLTWLGTSPLEFACFIVFWLLQLCVVWKGMGGIRYLEKYSAPILIALSSSLLVWAYIRAGGFSELLSSPSRLSDSEFWSLFFPSLTANIGSWSTVAINIPDFSRYAKSQKDQIIGQLGFPVFMCAFTFVGLAVTSSTQEIFGEVISNPIHLLERMGGGTWTKILAMLGISLATITTNIPANVVASANALSNLSPAVFSFRRGALLTAFLGIGFQPWRLLQSSNSYIYTWLVGYSALLGPIGSIILVDYYIIRRTELSVEELYSLSPRGCYYYRNGFNIAAIATLIVGILPMIPGFFRKVGILNSVPEVFDVIYGLAWFVGFFTSGILYWIVSLFESKKIHDQLKDPLLLDTSSI